MRPVTCKSVLSDPHILWARVILIHSSCMSGDATQPYRTQTPIDSEPISYILMHGHAVSSHISWGHVHLVLALLCPSVKCLTRQWLQHYQRVMSPWIWVNIIHSHAWSCRMCHNMRPATCKSVLNDPHILWVRVILIHSSCMSGVARPGVGIFVSGCEVLGPLVAATLPTGHATLNMSQYHTFPCMVMPYHHIHVSSLSDSLMQWQLILMHAVECKSAWNDPHPSMDMGHSQSFSAILMHSHAFTVLVAFL